MNEMFFIGRKNYKDNIDSVVYTRKNDSVITLPKTGLKNIYHIIHQIFYLVLILSVNFLHGLDLSTKNFTLRKTEGVVVNKDNLM